MFPHLEGVKTDLFGILGCTRAPHGGSRAPREAPSTLARSKRSLASSLNHGVGADESRFDGFPGSHKAMRRLDSSDMHLSPSRFRRTLNVFTKVYPSTRTLIRSRPIQSPLTQARSAVFFSSIGSRRLPELESPLSLASLPSTMLPSRPNI